jgi:RNA polymerase sigma factor (sigma-70 family)
VGESKGDSGARPLGERLGAQADRLGLLVTHLAGARIRARVEPEDLVQEVFLRALAAPERVPPPEPEEAALARFLNTLARHVVIDAARAIRAAKRDGNELPLTHGDWSHFGHRASAIAARTPGPLTRLGAREDARRLRTGFAALSPEHRRVIGLRQLEGLSARETGRRMGRSETAVHSLYRRALAAWDEALQRNPSFRDESGATPRPEGP